MVLLLFPLKTVMKTNAYCSSAVTRLLSASHMNLTALMLNLFKMVMELQSREVNVPVGFRPATHSSRGSLSPYMLDIGNPANGTQNKQADLSTIADSH